jgi:DNA-directed RNA polymerase specialized sigma24 family protein
LYTVARRASLRARANRARRREGERQAALGKPAATTPEDEDRRELRAVLDEELRRLPEKYQSPLILCYLEG